MATTTLTFDVDLQATPDQVWQTLTDPDTVPRWWFGMTFETDWRPGTRLSSQSPDGVGTVLAAAAGEGWSTTGSSWTHPRPTAGTRSTVGFEFIPTVGDGTHLRVEHSDLGPAGALCRIVTDGWPVILSNLKEPVGSSLRRRAAGPRESGQGERSAGVSSRNRERSRLDDAHVVSSCSRKQVHPVRSGAGGGQEGGRQMFLARPAPGASGPS